MCPPRSRVLRERAYLHVAEGEARPAEQEHLHEPVKRDRDLAEEKGAEELRRDQDVVDDEERERQRRRGAEDVEEIRQRGEAPLRAVELEEPVDAGREDEEGRQEQGQEMQLRVELRALEAHREGGDHGHRRRHDVMRDDERLLEVLPNSSKGRGRGGAGGIRPAPAFVNAAAAAAPDGIRVSRQRAFCTPPPLRGRGRRGVGADGAGRAPVPCGRRHAPLSNSPPQRGRGPVALPVLLLQGRPRHGSAGPRRGTLAGARLNH